MGGHSRKNRNPPITLNGLKIQVARAKPLHLQIWQVKDEQEETKVMVFWHGGILQSKQRFDNPLEIPFANIDFTIAYWKQSR